MRILLAAAVLLCSLEASAQWLDPKAKSVPTAKSAAKKFLLYVTQDKKTASVLMTKAEIEASFPKGLEVVLRPGEEPSYFDTVRTYDRFLAQDCAASVAEGATARIEKQSPDMLCRERPFILPDAFHGTRVAYDLTRDKKGIRIGMSVRFMTSEKDPSERALQMVDRIAAKCPDKLRGLLRRYGLGFDADFLVIRNPSYFDTKAETAHPTIKIDLVDAFGRADSGTYYYSGQDWARCAACVAKKAPCALECKEDVGEDFCATMAHELGHSMGLPDEYPAKECPDRPTVSSDAEPWSLMDTVFQPWESIELFPRHLAGMLRPLCKGTGAVIDQWQKPYFLAYKRIKK